jgi:hypothetical protein
LQDRVIQVVASESRSTSGLLAASGSGSPVEAEEELPRRDDPCKGRTGTGRRRTFITVHPARVAALLGISVEDATAELCSLLAAVGGGHGGASFAFVKLSTPDGSNPRQREEKGHIPAEPNQGVPGPVSMVFSFPPGKSKGAESIFPRRSPILLIIDGLGFAPSLTCPLVFAQTSRLGCDRAGGSRTFGSLRISLLSLGSGPSRSRPRSGCSYPS